MEARNRTLEDWFARIRSRQIKLPRFQRFEAWGHYQVTELINTVLQQLPAGAVLILEIGEQEPFISRTIVGAPTDGDRVTEHLLDGQQRLTALWRSLHNNYEDRTYFIKLEEHEEYNLPYYAVSYGRWMKNGKRYPLWLNEPDQLWKNKLIPLNLLRPDRESEGELKEWATQASDNDPTILIEILEITNKLRILFSKFNIPFLSLPPTTPKEIALNVFIRMNTSASPLSPYDIIVAQVEAGSEMSLHELIEELKKDVSIVGDYLNPPDVILAVNAILMDKPPTKTTFLSRDFSRELVENWETIRVEIKRAFNFLEEEKIFDGQRLPSDVVIYPLAALWALVPDGLDQEGEARTILRKYIWRAFFTDRYERSSSTRALVDYRQLKNLLTQPTNFDLPEVFDDDAHPLPNSQELVYAGWPVRKDRMARAILCVSLRAGGVDFADGSPVTRENIKKREYHHIFPDAWLRSRQHSDKNIFKALNCALVTWRTNRNISAKPPSQYIRERLDATSLGEDEIQRRLKTHLIPYEPIVKNDYELFLHERARLIHDVMTQLCRGTLI